MTDTQKHITEKLLNGYNIAASGRNGIRLRDPAHNVYCKIHPRTFLWLKRDVLRKTSNRVFVVDKRKVRAMHGNSTIKKTYTKMQKQKMVIDGYLRGAKIKLSDVKELIRLARDKKVVIVARGIYQYVIAADKILEWPLKKIMQRKIYNALKEK